MKTSQPKICKKNNQFTKICEDFSEEYLWKQSIHLQLFAFLLLRRRFSCPVCFILIGETNSQSRGSYCTNTAKISNCKKGGNFSSSRQRQSHLPLVAQVAKSFKEVVVDTCHSDICRVVYICDDDSYSGLLVFHLSVVLLMKCIPSRYIWEDDSFSGYNVFSQDIFVRMILLRITRLRSFQLNRTLPRWMIDRYRKIFDNCKIRSQYWKW